MVTKFIINPIYFELYELCDPVNPHAVRFRVQSRITSIDKASLDKKKIYKYDDINLVPSFGTRLYDFLWTTYPEIFCISNKLTTALTENSFSGWQVQPIRITDPKNITTGDYKRFYVTGPSLQLDSSRMTILDRPAPTTMGKPHKVCRGLFFDETKYDGSDFFLVWNTIIITKRVKQFLHKNRIRNIKITPILDVEIDKWIIDHDE